MKQLLTLILVTLCLKNVSSQITNSPSRDLEYCPLTNTTFTVNVPGYDPEVFSWTNGPIVVSTNYPPVNSSSSTQFSFVGRFQDLNNAQTFGVGYKRPGKSDTTEYITFKKIKSLFYGACTPIQPTTNPISAEVCKIVSIPLSFPNLQWKINGEPLSSACYGSITTFEYLLPVGWSLNGNPSTGVWMPAGNSVTLTSDLNTGSGLSVYIRPINTGCGSNLEKGEVTSLPISRPNPTLNITGDATQLCFPNSYNYILDGVPDGAVVSWPANSYFTISSSGNTAGGSSFGTPLFS